MLSLKAFALLERLLRAMPRNTDLIELSEELRAPSAVAAMPAKSVVATECAGCKARREKQRAKMQRYRAKK